MNILEKLEILSDSAKYDASCSSSGSDRVNYGGLGNSYKRGICHTWSADGRCVSLLKVLFTNYCKFDCAYCVNRRSNDVKRAVFKPRELANITIEFYKRNYIEGLFLSSGVIKNPDYTMEQIIQTLEILRYEYRFFGYIHAKVIPGSSKELVEKLGMLADRISVNIELPSEKSLLKIAPDKTKNNILTPMGEIKQRTYQAKKELAIYKNAPKFVPAGQTTQMIIGATPENDFQILKLAQGLYNNYNLKRVFFSAYIPINTDKLLPSINTNPPLLREHRLYQADWLLRFYGFKAEELLDDTNNMFNEYLDPKCNWAVNNIAQFPVEINTAEYQVLLRVPGIGVKSAKRIIYARKAAFLDFDSLEKIGVVMKRAKYFITCKGKMLSNIKFDNVSIKTNLIQQSILTPNRKNNVEQLSLFRDDILFRESVYQCITGQM